MSLPEEHISWWAPQEREISSCSSSSASRCWVCVGPTQGPLALSVLPLLNLPPNWPPLFPRAHPSLRHPLCWEHSLLCRMTDSYGSDFTFPENLVWLPSIPKLTKKKNPPIIYSQSMVYFSLTTPTRGGLYLRWFFKNLPLLPDCKLLEGRAMCIFPSPAQMFHLALKKCVVRTDWMSRAHSLIPVERMSKPSPYITLLTWLKAQHQSGSRSCGKNARLGESGGCDSDPIVISSVARPLEGLFLLFDTEAVLQKHCHSAHAKKKGHWLHFL